jgi:hypothetical protein
MNEAMKLAWLEIDQILGEPTREELDVFLRTWQRAIQAEREECAKICDAKYEEFPNEQHDLAYALSAKELAAAIRARGQA